MHGHIALRTATQPAAAQWPVHAIRFRKALQQGDIQRAGKRQRNRHADVETIGELSERTHELIRQIDETQADHGARNPRTHRAPVPAMREPVVTATATAIEHLQIVGQIEAAPRHEADDHDHHPRATADIDQHRERRHAFDQIEREAAKENKADGEAADQQRGAHAVQKLREHARHIEPGAIQRRSARRHPANDRNQAHRQKEPVGRDGQQAAHIIIRCDEFRRIAGDDRRRGEPEKERDEGGQLREQHREKRALLRRVFRNIASPVAERAGERDRIAHRHQHGAHEGRPETHRTERDLAGVRAIERPGKCHDADHEQQARRPYGDLVDPQHEAEAVHADGQHQHREQTVREAQRHPVDRQAEQMIRAAHQRVARTPYGQREESDRGQHRQKGADDPAMNTEMRAGRNRIARAVARTEQTHRREYA
ncbi:hypothetical protein KCU90_g4107, partial [Aureobasidium melanogenum]